MSKEELEQNTKKVSAKKPKAKEGEKKKVEKTTAPVKKTSTKVASEKEVTKTTAKKDSSKKAMKQEKKSKNQKMPLFSKSWVLIIISILFVIACFFIGYLFALNNNSYNNINRSNVDNTSQSLQNKKVIEEVQPAVFTVANYAVISGWQKSFFNLTEDEFEQSTGSGYIVEKRNNEYYLMTNFHVIQGSDLVRVIDTNGEVIDATVVGYDAANDMAMLKFTSTKDYPVLSLAEEDSLYLGQQVYAFGSPLGKTFSNSVTTGIISGLNRELSETGDIEYIQTDATINSGNSGGPLVNFEGKVIGMNTLKINQSSVENMGFAIPSDVIKNFVDETLANEN